ncbi:MAG: hypothetical protein AB7V62_17080 [Thermoleophilia bacterium]
MPRPVPVLLLAAAALGCPAGAPAASAAAPADRCTAGQVRVERPDGRARCLPRRPTRLWYRVRFETTFHQQWADPPRVLDQSWRFDSSGAVILFRQCSVAGLPRQRDARLATRVEAAASCARQARFLGIDLAEDVSFGASGTAVGGAYTDVTDYGLVRLRPYAGTPLEVNCDHTVVDTHAGSGPANAPAVLSTTSQSAGAGGLVFNQRGPAVDGAGRMTRPGAPCHTILGDASRPPIDRPLGVSALWGRDLIGRFAPAIGPAWGRPRIAASATVADSSGGIDRRADFALTLTRCPGRGGRTPAGC